MKTCLHCDTQNPDDAMNCQCCGTTTFVTSSPQAIGGHLITPAEKQFWQKMTFRDLTVLIIRIQALWFVFNIAIDLTYLPSYLERFHSMPLGISGYSQAQESFYLALLRIIINAAGALVCIQSAEKIASWLVKDLIPKSLSVKPEKPNSTG